LRIRFLSPLLLAFAGMVACGGDGPSQPEPSPFVGAYELIEYRGHGVPVLFTDGSGVLSGTYVVEDGGRATEEISYRHPDGVLLAVETQRWTARGATTFRVVPDPPEFYLNGLRVGTADEPWAPYTYLLSGERRLIGGPSESGQRIWYRR
jgi:hypothetical protein